MSEERKGWAGYQPTKAMLAWCCAGTAIATMVIGFTWGGWVTGGSAQTQVNDASAAARADLAAAICVDRFLTAPEVGERHAALMGERAWSRNGMISDAGWTTFAGIEKPVDGAAKLCADRLAEVDIEALQAQIDQAALDARTLSDGVEVEAN